MEQVLENFEIKNEDPELHSIDLILEVLNRHLHNHEECTSDEYEAKLKEKRIRVIDFVLGRVMSD
jgi:hypothetical protein